MLVTPVKNLPIRLGGALSWERSSTPIANTTRHVNPHHVSANAHACSTPVKNLYIAGDFDTPGKDDDRGVHSTLLPDITQFTSSSSPIVHHGTPVRPLRRIGEFEDKDEDDASKDI